MKRLITIITPDEAVQILREHGMSITPAHLRAGIDCGAYPFGVSIPCAKHFSYEIYMKPLMDWIASVSEEVTE